MPIFKGNFNTIFAWKAPYWTREGGRGAPYNTLLAGAPDTAIDNTFQRVAYDPASTIIPTVIHSDINGYTNINNPNGLKVGGQVATPAAPTVTPNTTGGATTVAYAIVARWTSGATTAVSATTTITNSQAALSASVYNSIVGVLGAGLTAAPYYDVYRLTAPGTPNTTGKIGTFAAATLANSPSATTFTFNDTGLPGDGTTPPSVNSTGGIVSPGGFTVGAAAQGVATVVMTSAQIDGMNATPFSVIAAPGVGKVLIAATDAIVAQYKPGATAFAGGGAITFQYHGTTIDPHSSNIPASALTTTTASVQQLPPPTTTIVPPPNTGLDITNATAPFTTGNGSLILTIPYTILTLS